MTTIQEFQEFIRDKYYATDSKRGTPPTFMWFIEEVGELATALAGDDQANKEEEFADVLAWLCTLANINDIDLSAAITKYTAGDIKGFKT
ncbi:MAG: nucleotide pyrophosphohydrolase [Phycisphaerae bacterium]|nr:nucleotide pyrophosphohydrolase [Phycisphaerae bacterium]